MKVEPNPTICNVCGGDVKYVPNFIIYGTSYGSGMCYLCQKCGAYTGTDKRHVKKALGLLANSEMRDIKVKCHALFDSFWKKATENGNLNKKMMKNHWYKWLAKKLGMTLKECHFSKMDMDTLKKAYAILKEQEEAMRWG